MNNNFMKITPLLILGLFFFTFINFSFAAITPFDWDTPKNPDEIGEPIQPNNATSTMAEPTTISGMIGNLKILRPDGIWENVSPGQVLKGGDTIRTDEKSSATGKISSGGEITVGPNSEFKFNLRGQSSQSQYHLFGYIELSFGFIRIKGWIKGGEIRTSEAICAIRGTDFIIARDPDAKITNIYLYEGLIDVDNLHGKTITLQPGESVSVDSDGQMTLGKLSEEKWNQLVNEISPAEISEQASESTAIKQEDKKPTRLWAGLIVVLLCAIGAGVFLYRKRS